MEITFSDKELADLYQGIKPKKKVWKSNQQMVKQFVKTINKMRAINTIEQFNQFGSLHYKKLTENLTGLSSVRMNEQFRLLFKEIENDDDPPQVVLLEIQEISNHYA